MIPPVTPSPPRVGDFSLLHPLGSGGMALVWHAERSTDGLPVAVKVMRPGGTEHPVLFRSEVATIAALDHPHIVRVLDHGLSERPVEVDGVRIEAGAPWLAMELAATNLAAAGDRLSGAAIVQLLDELLSALAHAHARGAIHRDIKPSNVLLRSRDEHCLLADFGISWLDRAEDQGQEFTIRLATPRFAAPEQLRGLWRDQGPWTDLYAVGCLAWSLATGQPPFPLADRAQLVEAHASWPLPRLRARVGLPAG